MAVAEVAEPPALAPADGADPYADGAIPPRVEVKNRPLRDKVALIILGVAFLANIILGAMVASAVKGIVGQAEDYNACVDSNSAAQTKIDIPALQRAVDEGQATVNAAASSISLDGITSSTGLLVGMSIGVVVFAGLWVFLLYRFTKQMVWGTLLFNVVLVVVVGVAFIVALPDGGATSGGVFFALAAIQLLFLYCLRNSVNMAAGLLNLAMQALRDFPALIVAGILINVLVLSLYILQMVFIISALTTVGYNPMSGGDIIAKNAEEPGSVVVIAPNGGIVQDGSQYCVAGSTGLATFGQYFFAVILLWLTATLEAVRMAIVSAVFGTFYYFAPDDPEKPQGIVCAATTWAFTKQLGTHAISGMVLAIIDQLKRMAKSRARGIVGLIVRLIVLCILSLIEQLSKFVVIMTGLTGLSFWDSAKRTVTILKEVFIDGYITSKITTRVLRLSGYIFAVVFGMIAWAGVDTSSFADLWFFVFIILIGIISPIFGIIVAIVLSSVLASVFPAEPSGKNPLSGPLSGLFFGSVAHAVILFMEQLILDLVDAAFMCFAIDAHNGIISPRGEVVHRFMGANFGDQLSDKGKESAGVEKEVENPAAPAGGMPPADKMPPPAPAAMPPPAAGGAYPGAQPPAPAGYPGTTPPAPAAYPPPTSTDL